MTRPRPLDLAAILAGGRGARMGADKARLDLGGETLAERVHRSVAAVAKRVIQVGGESALAHRGVGQIPDRYPGANALGGLATALGWAEEELGADAWVLVVACDLPFLEPTLLRRLAADREGADAVVPRTALGYEPLCAAYRAGAAPAFAAEVARGNLRIFAAYRTLRVREVPEADLRAADPDLRSFLNLNRPADLEAARALVAPGAGGS